MKFFVLFFLWNIIFPQINLDLKKSFISYTGSHPFHDWTAISHEIILETDCKIKSSHCELNIGIPIISFDSGNDNRDSNAFMIVDGLRIPKVVLTVNNFNMGSFIVGENTSVVASLNFNGLSKPQEIPLKLEINDNNFTINSSFKVSLESFNIKRPSLLFLPISDLILINAHLNGNFNE
jgi:hypothetical protein